MEKQIPDENVRLIPSGISLVDQAWGGFYKGGSYLIFGPQHSGRTLVGLQFAIQAASREEVCLYFTTSKPAELIQYARSIGMDIENYVNGNQIIIISTAIPDPSESGSFEDDKLAELFFDLTQTVNELQPDRIVFDELTPYVGFDSPEYLEQLFGDTTEAIGDSKVTGLYVLSEPATPHASRILTAISQSVTAHIHLQKFEHTDQNHHLRGIITITPNAGHGEGKFSANYLVEPSGLMLVDINPGNDTNLNDYQNFLHKIDQHLGLIRVFGTPFRLFAFQIDKHSSLYEIVDFAQLKNAVLSAAHKNDILCFTEDCIYVFVPGERANNGISTLSNFLKKLIAHVSVAEVPVTGSPEDAESLMEIVNKELNYKIKAIGSPQS